MRRSKGPISLILPHCIGSSWLVHRDTVHGLSSHQIRYHLILRYSELDMARPGPSGVGGAPTPLAADNSKVRLGRKGARGRDRDGQRVLAMPGLRWLLTPDEGGSWTLD